MMSETGVETKELANWKGLGFHPPQELCVLLNELQAYPSKQQGLLH